MTLRPRQAADAPAPSGASFGQLLAIITAFALVTGVMVAFVRLKSLQVEAGYRVHDLRQRLVILDQQRAALEVERAALARPQRIAHLARTTLGLVPPEINSAVAAAATPGSAP